MCVRVCDRHIYVEGRPKWKFASNVYCIENRQRQRHRLILWLLLFGDCLMMDNDSVWLFATLNGLYTHPPSKIQFEANLGNNNNKTK